MSQKEVLRLGTRRSLLAQAQSAWVAREIERFSPWLRVELVGMDTKGDQILDIPLSKIEGKEFFVAELDEALKSKRVDLCVHSLKDLSLERPSEFVLAAIPKREDPRDVILFHPRTRERIAEGKPVRIGTSAPRRIENLPPFLKAALPRLNRRTPELEFVEIRGNVNTRLARVHEPDGSDRQLDGVVLALAGLSRLSIDEAGKKELDRLLENLLWMVLPLTDCPTAPGQGALAIECRADDRSALAAIKPLHHEATASAVATERKVLADWGGGCHQKLGATSVSHTRLGPLFFLRGRTPQNIRVENFEWILPRTTAGANPWNGNDWRSKGATVRREAPISWSPRTAVFVAHHRAWPDSSEGLEQARIWTSGTKSWFRLAEKGLWVEGCAEGLGWSWVKPLVEKPVLGLPRLQEWRILTHDEGASEWSAFVPSANIFETYSISTEAEPDEAGEALSRSEEVYFSSGSQYRRLSSHLRATARISCGPGRTYETLLAEGHTPLVFPSVETWKKWIGQE